MVRRRRKLLVFVTHPAYGHENAFAGLYVALGALSKNLDATVVLACDGVFTGIKGQAEPLERLQLPSVEEQVNDILDLGGDIVAIEEDAAERGLQPADLVDGIRVVPSSDIPALIVDHGELQVTF